MDNLVGLSVQLGHDADGVFYAPCLCMLFKSASRSHEQVYALLLATIGPLGCKVTAAADGQMCAWRASDDKIPAILDDLERILLTVEKASVIGWQQVAGPCITANV